MQGLTRQNAALRKQDSANPMLWDRQRFSLCTALGVSGNKLTDLSPGKLLIGTKQSGASWASSEHGPVIYSPGTGYDGVMFPADSKWRMAGAEFHTIEINIRIHSWNSYDLLFVDETWSNNTFHCYPSGNKFYTALKNDGDPWTFNHTSPTISWLTTPDGKFHQLLYRYGKDHIWRMYIDGSYISADSYAIGPINTTTGVAANTTRQLGVCGATGGRSGPEADLLSFRMWDRAISDAEMQLLADDPLAQFRPLEVFFPYIAAGATPTYPITGGSISDSSAAATLAVNHATAGDSSSASTAAIAASVAHSVSGDSPSVSTAAIAAGYSAPTHAIAGDSSSSSVAAASLAANHAIAGDSPTSSSAAASLAVSHAAAGDSGSSSTAAIAAAYVAGGTYPIAGDSASSSSAAASLAVSHAAAGDSTTVSSAVANLATLHKLIGQAISASAASFDLAGGTPTAPRVSLVAKTLPRSSIAATISRSLKAKTIPRSFSAK